MPPLPVHAMLHPVLRGLAALALAPLITGAQDLFPSPLFAGNNFTQDLIAADLDRDGRPDLVAFQTIGDAIAVYASEGAQGYAPGVATPISDLSQSHHVLDATGDGRLDVVVVQGTFTLPSAVVTFAGDGQGGLSPVDLVTISTSIETQARGLASADLDGDGDLDVVATVEDPLLENGNDGGVFVLLAKSAGGFEPPVHHPVVSRPGKGTFGDLDGDGAPDLVCPRKEDPVGGPGALVVLRGDGQGAFHTPVAHGIPESSAERATLGDLDGDGDLDAVFRVNMWEGGTYVSLGDGSGALGPAALLPAPAPTGRVEVGDLTGDGRADIVSALTQIDSLAIHVALPGGGFSAPALIAAGEDPTGLAVADLDADGTLDIAFGNGNSSSVLSSHLGALYGDGSGAFGPLPSTPLPGQPSAIAAGDLDGDGLPDVAVSLGPDAAFAVVLGPGGAQPTALPPHPLGGAADRLFLGDLDQDGDADVVATAAGVGLSVCLGLGGGGFAPAIDVPLASQPVGLAQLDLDGDGLLDAVTVSSGPLFQQSELTLLLSVAPGVLSVAATMPVGAQAHDLAVGDVDGDGVLDVAVAASTSTWLRGDGAGGLSQAGVLIGGGDQRSIALGDLTGDGVLDAAIGLVPGVKVRFGQGGGSFGVLHFLGSSEQVAFELEMADLDRDGAAELISTDEMVFAVDVIDLPALPGVLTRHILPHRPRAFALADLDLDGAPDAAIAGTGGTGAVVFLPNLLPPPAGLASYGAGTPGCLGEQVLLGASPPAVGASEFALTCTNAPPTAAGLVAIAALPDVAGSDPLGVGLIVHLDAASLSPFLPIASDGSGAAHLSVPVPDAPGLAGAVVHAQAFWPWSPLASCDPSPLLWSTSRGLTLTVAP